MWSNADFSLKTLLNKRVTDSVNKGVNNEFGDFTINIHAQEVWLDPIPNVPPGISFGPLQLYSSYVLTQDTTVPNSQTWFTAGPTGLSTDRLKNWVSDKYNSSIYQPGQGYSVQLFTGLGTQIPLGDTSNWLFDYVTGILVFGGSQTLGIAVTAAGPFSITAYRYVGRTGLSTSGLLTGTVGTTQIAYGIGSNIIGSSPNLVFSGTNFGIGTNNPTQTLDINGGAIFRSAIYDGVNTSGQFGQILTSTGAGVAWSAITQSGLTGSVGSNQIAFGTSGGILTGSNNLIFTGSNFGIGTANPSQTLSVWGTSFLGNGVAVSFINNNIFDASTLVTPGQGFIGVYHYGTFWQGNGIAFNSQVLGNKVLGMVVNANTMYFGSATDNIDFLTLSTSQSNFLDNNSYNILSINATQGTVIQNSNTNDQKALAITKNDTLTTSSTTFVGISTITLPVNCMLTIEGMANGWASTTFNEGGTFMTVFYNNGSGAVKIGGATNVFSKFTGSGGNFEVLGIGNTVYVMVKATPGTSWIWRLNYKCLISQNY